MTKILLDGREYLHIIELTWSYDLVDNIAYREVNISAVNSINFKDFLLEIRTKNRMLASVFIKDKLFLEGFIMYGDIKFSKNESGFNISFEVKDRFFPIRESDVIRTRDSGTLQQYIANVLSELRFDSPEFINTYPRHITRASDFIKNGDGVTSQKIKTFKRAELAEKNSHTLIAQSLNFSHNIIISNGSDTLTIEKVDLDKNPVFRIYDDVESNISYYEKAGEEEKKQTPAMIVVLNSGVSEEGKKIQDTNTAIVQPFKKGRPNYQSIFRINTATSIQNINRNLDFYLKGMVSKSNTFNFTVPGVIFDKYGNFFQPNRYIRVFVKDIGLDEDMKILSVRGELSGDGSVVTFNLTSKEAINDKKNTNHKRSL